MHTTTLAKLRLYLVSFLSLINIPKPELTKEHSLHQVASSQDKTREVFRELGLPLVDKKDVPPDQTRSYGKSDSKNSK